MRKILISAVIVLGAAIVVACSNSNSAKKDVEPQCDTAKIEVEEVVDTLADIEFDEDTYELNGVAFKTYEASDGDGEYASSASLILPVPNGDKVMEKILQQLVGEDADINNIQAYLDKMFSPEEKAKEADDDDDLQVSTVWNINPVLVLDKYLVMETADGYMDNYMAHYNITQSTIVFDRTTGEIMSRDGMFKEDSDWLKMARKFRDSANEDLGEFDGSDFEDPDGFLIDEVFGFSLCMDLTKSIMPTVSM